VGDRLKSVPHAVSPSREVRTEASWGDNRSVTGHASALDALGKIVDAFVVEPLVPLELRDEPLPLLRALDYPAPSLGGTCGSLVRTTTGCS